MNNFWKVFIPYTLLAVLGFILGLLTQKGCNKPKPQDLKIVWQQAGFKTDTIYQPKYIEHPITHQPNSPVPPVSVTLFDIPDLKLPESGDTPNYESFYPNKPKLITGVFKSDSVILDLWKPNTNRITRESYKTPFNSYEFFYDGETMHYVELPSKNIPPVSSNNTKVTTSSFTYLTYELFDKKPELAVDYSINYGKFAVYSMGSFGYMINDKDMRAQLKVGLRLKLK